MKKCLGKKKVNLSNVTIHFCVCSLSQASEAFSACISCCLIAFEKPSRLLAFTCFYSSKNPRNEDKKKFNQMLARVRYLPFSAFLPLSLPLPYLSNGLALITTLSLAGNLALAAAVRCGLSVKFHTHAHEP